MQKSLAKTNEASYEAMTMRAYEADLSRGPKLVRIGAVPFWTTNRSIGVAVLVGVVSLLLGLWVIGAGMGSRFESAPAAAQAQRVAQEKADEADRLKTRNRRLEALVQVLQKRASGERKSK